MKKLVSAIKGLAMICLLASLNASAQTTDIGVSALVSPTTNLCSGSLDVIVIIENFGTNDVNNATIDWSVNGIPQPTVVYTNTLLSGVTDTVILGSYNFLPGTSNTLIASTANPNGLVDDDSSNDTLARTISIPMSGTYTVGGTAPNFARITDAITALSTFGVCGPTTFDIRPLIDTVRIIIPTITGASASNTITFQAENGDSSSVKFTFRSDVLAANPNYVILLDGADYININHLTLERTGLEPNARVIEFKNSSCNINITGCQLIGAPQIQVANSLAAILYSSAATPTNDSNVVISGNLLKNGALGIYMNGVASLNPENGVVIDNNTFLNQYAKGMDLTNHGGLVVRGNTITTNTAYTQFTAIELDRSQRNQNITKNKISGNVKVGLNFIDCSGYNGTPGLVANNFVQATDSIGIRVNNGDYQHYYFNSINMTGANSAAFEISGIGVGNRVIDNIMANSGGGISYRVANSATAGLQSSNYNDLFSTGANVGSFNATLTATLNAWRTTAAHDTNSVSADPTFTSITDLHTTSTALDNTGTPVTGVADDIDNTSRSLTTPDIGADEFTGIARDLAVTAIIDPLNLSCGSTNTLVSAIVTNFGGATATGFNVYMTSSLTGSTATVLFSDSLPSGVSDTVTFSNPVNTSAGGIVTFSVYTGLAIDIDRSNDTLTVTRTITAIPAAPITTGDSICGGGLATLTATGTGSINWYSASTGGTSIFSGNSFITPAISASTDYYASVTFGGCEGPRAAASVTILPQPIVSLGNDTSAIQGSSVTLNAGSGFSTYLWNDGSTASSITVTTDGCYSVIVSNSYGCTATDTACVLFVLATDLSTGAITSPTNSLCTSSNTPVSVWIYNNGPNDATNITIVATIAGSVSTSISNVFAGPLAVQDSVEFLVGTINTTNGGNLNISATIDYSSDSNTGNNTTTGSFSLLVQPTPPVTVDISFCGTQSVALNATSSQTIYWYDAPTGGNLLGQGPIAISNLSQSTTFYAQSGIICTNQDRSPLNVTVNPLPVVNLGPDTSVTLPITLDAGPGFLNYSWSTLANTQTILVTQSGSYYVTVENASGCLGSDTVNVQFGVGVTSTPFVANVSIYPNPTSGHFILEGTSLVSGQVNLSVTDLRGALISTQPIKVTAGYIHEEMNLNGLAKGVYTIRLISENATQQLRLIIE